VWDPLFNELNEIINAHAIFIDVISKEVEAPIREIANSDEWNNLKNVSFYW